MIWLLSILEVSGQTKPSFFFCRIFFHLTKHLSRFSLSLKSCRAESVCYALGCYFVNLFFWKLLEHAYSEGAWDSMADTTQSNLENYAAVLFDMDGVLTATAKLHAICWKQMFDEYLQQKALASGIAFQPFDIDHDYRLYVDGKLRYEGVQSFLQSRAIELPWGSAESPPEEESVCGLGNRKDRLVNELLAAGNVSVFEGSIKLVHHLRANGVRTAVVSASKNCEAILNAAGITELFEVRVDGKLAESFSLPGKPEPDTFLKAAELLGVEPAQAVVVEDAIAGVQAGQRGAFGLVVGVDRHGDAEALKANGANLVVNDLAELLPK
jgi:beta-phosphoglucomutase family hydrolase